MTWMRGKITGRDFPDQAQLARSTWQHIERGIRRYMADYRHRPWVLVLHPADLAEVLLAFDAPDADLLLLEGLAIQIDVRCTRARLIGRWGWSHRL